MTQEENIQLGATEVIEWVAVSDRLPIISDGDQKGYVMVFLRTDRQWGWPTNVGFGKWNRVSSRSHTHWRRCPKPPVQAD